MVSSSVKFDPYHHFHQQQISESVSASSSLTANLIVDKEGFVRKSKSLLPKGVKRPDSPSSSSTSAVLPARRRLMLQQGRQRRLANENYANMPTKSKILKMLKTCEAVERDVSIASSILEAVNDRR